jgi:hypothetical protein
MTADEKSFKELNHIITEQSMFYSEMVIHRKL